MEIILKKLKMPKLWSAKFERFTPTVPGYWDLVADWVALLIARLINHQGLGSIRLIDTLDYIDACVANQDLQACGTDFRVFADREQIEQIINFIANEGVWQHEKSLIKQRKGNYEIEMEMNERGEDILLINEDAIKCMYKTPKLALPMDTWPNSPIEHYLGSKLRKENAKLTNKSTKVCGLWADYCLYSTKVQASHLTSFWYKHKEGGKNVIGHNGAAFNAKGATIIKNHGCFIRCLIHRFASLSRPIQQMMCSDHSNLQATLDAMDFTLAEAYDWKLIKFVFGRIKSALSEAYGGTISLLELEYAFIEPGAFFVDRELIINCIYYHHAAMMASLDGDDDVYLIGDGRIGPLGEVCIDTRGSGRFPVPKQQQLKQYDLNCTW